MKVLVLGSGAREHAITWKFSQTLEKDSLFVAPGNAGMAEIATLVPINPDKENESVVEFCLEKNIDFVFVGPEIPLANGVVDALNAVGIASFGPHKEAAQLESSKVFSKKFMNRHKIPTADAFEFNNLEEYTRYIQQIENKIVVKKSGLAAGKGVFESDDKKALLEFGSDILKSDRLLVEEFLTGYEVSIFVLMDGKHYVVLPPCADFKKAGEGDTGLNTGGMGSICPVPCVTKELKSQINKEIVEPVMAGLKKDQLTYKGLLYIGLMITEKGPKVLEFNVRFGDPETQPLLMGMPCHFEFLANALKDQKLDELETEGAFDFAGKAAVGVVVAAEGYPGAYKKDCLVTSVPPNAADLMVFHAATVQDDRGNLRTAGGRCFTVVGLADNLQEAAKRAYEGVAQLQFEGCWSRKDIGRKFFQN